jgi:hypothetical protein
MIRLLTIKKQNDKGKFYYLELHVQTMKLDIT